MLEYTIQEEDIVEKEGENDGFQHFLLFPHFSTAFPPRLSLSHNPMFWRT